MFAVVFLPDVSGATWGSAPPEARVFVRVTLAQFAVLTRLLREPFERSLSFAAGTGFLP